MEAGLNDGLIDAIWDCLEEEDPSKLEAVLEEIESAKEQVSGQFRLLVESLAKYTKVTLWSVDKKLQARFSRTSMMQLADSALADLRESSSGQSEKTSSLRDYCMAMLYQWVRALQQSNRHLLAFLAGCNDCPSWSLAQARLTMADNYQSLGDNASAVSVARKLLKSDTDLYIEANARLILLRAYSEMDARRKFRKCARALKELIEDNPDDVPPATKWGFFLCQGMFLVKHEKLDEGIASLREALSYHHAVEGVVSESSVLHRWIASAYQMKHDYDYAVKYYELALEREQDDRIRKQILVLAGICSYSSGRYKDSIGYNTRALDLLGEEDAEERRKLEHMIAQARSRMEE